MWYHNWSGHVCMQSGKPVRFSPFVYFLNISTHSPLLIATSGTVLSQCGRVLQVWLWTGISQMWGEGSRLAMQQEGDFVLVLLRKAAAGRVRYTPSVLPTPPSELQFLPPKDTNKKWGEPDHIFNGNTRVLQWCFFLPFVQFSRHLEVCTECELDCPMAKSTQCKFTVSDSFRYSCLSLSIITVRKKKLEKKKE